MKKELIKQTDSLPRTGEPGSSQTLYNPDGTPKQKRWYGQDGKATRDRDYNHSGNLPFPHDHVWQDGERTTGHLAPSPDYEFSVEPLIGLGVVTMSAVGIALIAVDDVTVVGIGDDFLFAPLCAGVSVGAVMIGG